MISLISSFFKFVFTFIFCFLVLSVPIKQKSLFYYISNYTHPITKDIYAKIDDSLREGSSIISTFFENIFKAEIPKESLKNHARTNSDQVDSKMSGISRALFHSPKKKQMNEEKEAIQNQSGENYSQEEKRLLDAFIEKNSK
jgi:hypothetical protein